MTKTEFARLPQNDSFARVKLPALKKTVAQILRNSKKEESDTSELSDFGALQQKVNNACIYQYSYSSLAAKKQVLEDISIDGNRTNREDIVEDDTAGVLVHPHLVGREAVLQLDPVAGHEAAEAAHEEAVAGTIGQAVEGHMVVVGVHSSEQAVGDIVATLSAHLFPTVNAAKDLKFVGAR
jgi:hypothetical protein